MMHFCTKCSTQDGVTSRLEEEAGGILVCKNNPKHRFKLDESGCIHSVE